MIGPISGASSILTNNLKINPVKCGAEKINKQTKESKEKLNQMLVVEIVVETENST